MGLESGHGRKLGWARVIESPQTRSKMYDHVEVTGLDDDQQYENMRLSSLKRQSDVPGDEVEPGAIRRTDPDREPETCRIEGTWRCVSSIFRCNEAFLTESVFSFSLSPLSVGSPTSD